MVLKARLWSKKCSCSAFTLRVSILFIASVAKQPEFFAALLLLLSLLPPRSLGYFGVGLPHSQVCTFHSHHGARSLVSSRMRTRLLYVCGLSFVSLRMHTRLAVSPFVMLLISLLRWDAGTLTHIPFQNAVMLSNQTFPSCAWRLADRKTIWRSWSYCTSGYSWVRKRENRKRSESADAYVTSTIGCKETQNSALGSNGGGARVSDSQGKAYNTSAAKLKG